MKNEIKHRIVNTQRIGFGLLFSFILSTPSWVNAESLNADWLYFSNAGSWVSMTQTLENKESRLPLPIQNLSVDQFWWQASEPQTFVSWKQPDYLISPPINSAVEIIGESGIWLVTEKNDQLLVLKQGRVIRYWPKAQWHLLKWNTAAIDTTFELKVVQPNKAKNELFYAWLEPMMTGQIRYRLDLDSKKLALIQEFIVSNHSSYDVTAPGYSFAQNQMRPNVAMRASMIQSSELSAVSAPQTGQSQGVPTLFSNQTVQLSAGTDVWLPVSTTELASAKRMYKMHWDTRQQGLVQAQSNLKLTSVSPLPLLPGSVKIGVFDQQVAMLESFYQPSQPLTADLSLGASQLVTMKSNVDIDNRWQLTFSNRTQSDADIELMLSHWNGNKQQIVPMTVHLKADSTKQLKLEISNAGKLLVTGK